MSTPIPSVEAPQTPPMEASQNPPIEAPQTPPRRKNRYYTRDSLDDFLRAGSSPSAASTSDSGVEDLFDSPLKPKAVTTGKLLSPKNVYILEVEDVFNSPLKPDAIATGNLLSPKSVYNLEVEDSEEEEEESQWQDALNGSTPSLAEEESSRKFMPENPFESEHSSILFSAIDQLQSWASIKNLNPPQAS